MQYCYPRLGSHIWDPFQLWTLLTSPIHPNFLNQKIAYSVAISMTMLFLYILVFNLNIVLTKIGFIVDSHVDSFAGSFFFNKLFIEKNVIQCKFLCEFKKIFVPSHEIVSYFCVTNIFFLQI